MSIWRRFLRKMGARDLCSTCVERGVCRNRRRNGQGPRRNCRFFKADREEG